jgi:hypothetical protein
VQVAGRGGTPKQDLEQEANMRSVVAPTPILLVILAAPGCDRSELSTISTAPEPSYASALAAKELDVTTCAFGQPFTLSSINAYFPIGVGSQWELEGEEKGALIELRIRVLDETEVVGGVTTRVVEEVEWEDGELLEVSRNFVAETEDGTVCYFGEEVDIFEDGGISHAGQWRADAPGNFPGILMPADPVPGLRFTMEGAPTVAEDVGRIVGAGPTRTPAGLFTEVIRIRESRSSRWERRPPKSHRSTGAD